MGRNLSKPLGGALARIAYVLGEKDLGAIAEKLEIPYGTVRNWHQRGSVSLAGLQAAAKRTGRSIEFFLEGAQDGAKKFVASGLQLNQKSSGDEFGLVVNKSADTGAFGQESELTKKDNLFAKSASADAYGVYPPRENLQHGVAAMENRPTYGPRAWNAEMPRKLEKPYAEVLWRLMLSYKARTLAELASRMDVPENTVRNWHKRDGVPLARIEQAVNDSKMPFEWFMNGDSAPLFFDDEAKQLAKNDTSDAFGQVPEVTENLCEMHIKPTAPGGDRRANNTKVQQNVPSTAALNADLLADVLGAALQELENRGISLPPSKLAQVIALIYEDVGNVLPAPLADTCDWSSN